VSSLQADHHPSGARSLRFSFTTTGADGRERPRTGSIRLGGMTREEVLAAIRDHWPAESFSTTDLAVALDAPEYPIRAVVGWLVAGLLLAVVPDVERRHDRSGKPYKCARYRLTSDCGTIRRVTQDRLHRGPAVAPDLAEAARFLSVPWR
jgi:hypothetical protein